MLRRDFMNSSQRDGTL